MSNESLAMCNLRTELAMRLVSIEDEIHRRGLKTIENLTLIARDKANDKMFVCVTNENPVGLLVACGLALGQQQTQPDPLYVVMSYDPKGVKGILAIKATREEAEAVQARWAEIVEGSDIEEWRIGDDLEPES